MCHPTNPVTFVFGKLEKLRSRYHIQETFGESGEIIQEIPRLEHQSSPDNTVMEHGEPRSDSICSKGCGPDANCRAGMKAEWLTLQRDRALNSITPHETR